MDQDTFILNDKEYMIDNLTTEQKGLLANVQNLNFQLGQLEFSKQAFINALEKSLNAEVPSDEEK